MREILIEVEKHTSEIFCEVKDGKVSFVSNGKSMPLELIMYQKMPNDGFYTVDEATCGGSCSIGKPAKKCIGGMYSPRKCCVYSLNKAENVMVSIGTLLDIFGEIKNDR